MTTKNMHATSGAAIKGYQSLFFTLALALMLVLGAEQIFASGNDDYVRNGSGYSGPGPALVTVEQTKGMHDDTRVALKGNIIQRLGGKHYMFKDETGTITVEISDKRWPAQSIGPNDLVEIQGKVDKDWSEVKIEVKQIIKR